MRSAVNRLLAQKGASFEQANIYRVSQAAAPLAAWVTANLQYADVLQKVAPLEQELGGLTANFTDSQVRQEPANEASPPYIALARVDHSAWQTDLSMDESSASHTNSHQLLAAQRQEGMLSCLPCSGLPLSLPSCDCCFQLSNSHAIAAICVLHNVSELLGHLRKQTWDYGKCSWDLLQERIAGCEMQLQQLDEQVISLKAEFESKKGLEIELKNSLARAEATLSAATALLGKLAGEKTRWEAQVCLFLACLLYQRRLFIA